MIIRRVPVLLSTASTAAHASASSSNAHPRYHKGPSLPYSLYIYGKDAQLFREIVKIFLLAYARPLSHSLEDRDTGLADAEQARVSGVAVCVRAICRGC
jgi:hypothetical protein